MDPRAYISTHAGSLATGSSHMAAGRLAAWPPGSLAAGRWPLAAGRWPLAAGRWPPGRLAASLE